MMKSDENDEFLGRFCNKKCILLESHDVKRNKINGNWPIIDVN